MTTTEPTISKEADVMFPSDRGVGSPASVPPPDFLPGYAPGPNTLPTPAELAQAFAPDHSVRRHHRYGMSKLNAFAACPGYDPRDSSNAAAEDGTRLHEIMDQLTRVVAREHNSGPHMVACLDRLAEMGPIDPSEYTWLRQCCEGVDFWLARSPATIHNEIKVKISNPDGTELNHGHLDLLLIYRSGSAVLIDYKFGWGPVPEAEGNLQGMGYALGCFERFPELNKIGVVFMQPKLNKKTICSYERHAFMLHYERIRYVIAQAEKVRLGTLDSYAFRPNANCDYCARAGHCPALVAIKDGFVQKFSDVPLPVSIRNELRTPVEVARAVYHLKLLKLLIKEAEEADDGISSQALALAKASPDGRLTIEVAPGQFVVLESHKRKAPRSVQHPALVAELTKDVLTEKQVLACCDLSVTKLEDLFADNYVEQRDKLADAVIADATARADLHPSVPKITKQMLAEAKVKAKEMRSTKKAAKELLGSVLTSEGLMSRADAMVEYLKIRFENSTKQIGDTQVKQLT